MTLPAQKRPTSPGGEAGQCGYCADHQRRRSAGCCAGWPSPVHGTAWRAVHATQRRQKGPASTEVKRRREFKHKENATGSTRIAGSPDIAPQGARWPERKKRREAEAIVTGPSSCVGNPTQCSGLGPLRAGPHPRAPGSLPNLWSQTLGRGRGQTRSLRHAVQGQQECFATAKKVTVTRRIDPTCDSIPQGCVAVGGPRKMPDHKLLALARDLRARAEEILAKAETMSDTDAQEMMRAVAARYEKLAQRVEQQADEA